MEHRTGGVLISLGIVVIVASRNTLSVRAL